MNILELTKKQFKEILKLLINPPKPNTKLKESMKQHK